MPGLVVTRKVGSAVTIGAEIRIEVVSASGGTARLCIVAPKELQIVREEPEAPQQRRRPPFRVIDLTQP